MKNLILTISLLLTFSLVSQLVAQTTVSGTVSDEKGETLIGASVYLENTTIGTITDYDGTYELVVEETTPFNLVVSYTGYSTMTKEVTAGGVVDFVLSSDALGLDEVIVTGVANAKSKLSSSVSITTLKPDAIAQSAPRTTAEIFRTIPGIRSEASGGDGNTNITVRGIPISAGGSKYLQLQEDGLPILLFGDIAFATSDIFLRPDANIARIEAIRGGSAATLASNSPGGVINFISKTGAVKGGSIANTFGVDYNSFRTDFDYGSPIGNGVNFHVGGFFRKGEGPRDVGYTANNGGQLKANLTKTFKNGYARVSYKYLNDRTAAYMPMAIQVTGTNADPKWESVDGFSAQNDATHSIHLQNNFGLDSDGNRRNASVSDGMRALTNAIGAEFSFDFAEGWNFDSRARYATNRGRFVAPFPSTFGTTGDMVAAIEGAVGNPGDLTGASLTYAHNGDPFTGDLAQIIHMFDTELKNFNNISSDTKLTKEFGEKVSVSAGFFTSQQNINMSWLWNSYLMEVKGENAGLIDITRADGVQITEGGQFAYGVPVWGNCCQREYNIAYDVKAPYASIALDATDNLSIDASFRYDFGSVTGSTAGGVQATVDVNNDGTISPVEESVSVIDNSTPAGVDYDYDYASFSIGTNYQFNDKMAAFGRFSRGGSAKADRIVNPGTPIDFVGNPKDMINQAELGWKQKFSKGGLFVTAFYAATTEEGGFEATTQTVIKNDYRALGLEVEGAVAFGDFALRSALTYTSAEITSGDNKGNTPRRQPALMYNVIPTYTYKEHSIGLSLIGQTKAYAQDGNELVMPGYAIVNAFVNVNLVKGLSVGLNANNLFNTIGITESEEGSITENQVNYIRARSITGRSVAATIKFNF